MAPQHSLDLKFYFYSYHGTKNCNRSQIHSNGFIYFERCQRCQIDSPGEQHFQFLCTPGTAQAAAVLASCPCFPSKPPRSGEGPPRCSAELSLYYLELFLCSQPVSSLLCYSHWKHHPRQMCFCEEHLSAENRNGNETHLCTSHQMSRRS